MTIALNVIESSTPEVFDFLVYPEQHPGTIQYLQNQFQNISSTILDSGRQFMESSRQLFEKFYDGSVERAARAAVRMAKNLIHPNAVQRLDSLDDLQSAGPLMQRYIMTEPYIREKYLNQLCSGYAGSYVDLDPGKTGPDQYDWRRVNNGMAREVNEGNDREIVFTNYFEDLREGDRELSFDEKVDVMSSAELAKLFMKEGFDSTCPFGSKVG